MYLGLAAALAAWYNNRNVVILPDKILHHIKHQEDK